MLRRIALLLLLFGASGFQALAEVASLRMTAPDLALTGIPFTIELEALDPEGALLTDFAGPASISGLEGSWSVESPPSFEGGRLILGEARLPHRGRHQIRVEAGGAAEIGTVRVIPGFLSLLPPLLAILLALIIRQVVVSLAAGIWLGAVILFDYDVFGGIFRVVDHFVVNSVTETSHVQIILFSMLFGGMVGVITRNGGTRGIADLITRFARTARGGQIATWAMSFVLFFDDYANVLVRGNLMRPITDKLRISREKLAFLVDTGAATVASIFLISTWIGYEVGLIDQGLRIIGSTQSAYAMFIETIPYRFYPLFALILALLVSWTNRDFGPMLTAERRARRTGQTLRPGSRPATDLTETTVESEGETPPRWINGLLPILTILAVGLGGLWMTGVSALEQQGAASYGIGEIISEADSYAALLWASLAGCLVAILLTVAQRIMKLIETMDAWFSGLKAMLLAMVILVLAWSIGAVTEELHTAGYLVEILRGTLSPFWLPVLTFLIAALMAFATGTSWGTMAIMMPLVIPLAHNLGTDAGLDPTQLQTILRGVISSVLAGAVFGDHCSPISDTTILSSMASACDHIDHVRTQLPYALLAAIVGMVVGDIPTAYGMSPWISLPLGTATMIGFLFWIGKNPNQQTAAAQS